MSTMKSHTNKQAGFTIVELMISLSILSLVLLISSLTLIQLGKIFTKGVNQANAQDTTRNVVNDISSRIQFSGNPPYSIPFGTFHIPANPDSTSVICLGSSRYTFKLQHRLTNTATDHGLWRDTMTSSGGCQANQKFNTDVIPEDNLSIVGSGSEILPVGMRLTRFDVTGNPDGSYTVTVTIALSDAGSGADDLVVYDPATGITTCNTTQGSEYCSISSLTKTVVRRLTN